MMIAGIPCTFRLNHADIIFISTLFEIFSDLQSTAVYIALAQSISWQGTLGYQVHHDHTQISTMIMHIVYVLKKL